MHHPKADKDRLHLIRCEGDGTVIQVELTYKTRTVGLQRY